MLDKARFLEKFHLAEKDLDENNINWNNLVEIYKDYQESINTLETQASFISELLRSHNKVHTVRSRTKNPEHLIAKLIRKTKERKNKYGNDFEFTVRNYKDEITDLIGVRAIHIFKDDWIEIHRFIRNTWNVIEEKANIREGDSTEIFTELNIEIDKRTTGYRSVHYLIEFTPTLKKVVAEIQVRTIFEEGYGEIDHQLRYPHNDVPNILELNLLMLNRVAGSSDEMASFINLLKYSWDEMTGKYEKQISELKQIIEKSNMEDTDKKDAITEIQEISTNFDVSFANNSKVRSLAALAGEVKSISSLYSSAFNNININTVASITAPLTSDALRYVNNDNVGEIIKADIDVVGPSDLHQNKSIEGILASTNNNEIKIIADKTSLNVKEANPDVDKHEKSNQ